MSRKNRKCLCCNVDYHYCPTCSQDRMKPSWMSEFHDENCKNIFDICTRFNMELMSKENAQKALSACDLSNKANFKDYVQRDITNIFADEKPASKAKKAKSHEVVKQENE